MPLLNYLKQDKILKVTLSDPSTKNAFSPAMADELKSVLDKEEFDGFFLTGQGPLFCSGGNLSFYKGLPKKQQGLGYNKRITELLDHIYQLPVPTSCYVQGPCYGGGIELVSCFDWVVAHPASLFGLWQRRVGLTFGWGGQQRLQAKIGKAPLESWLFQGSTWPASKAQEAGLVNQTTFYNQGEEAGVHFIEKALKYGATNFAKIKSDRQTQDKIFSQLWMAEDHKRALDRFKN